MALLTFKENVRSDARQTLEYFHGQNVGLKVISGDHPRTVAAVAREVGMHVEATASTPPGCPRTRRRCER